MVFDVHAFGMPPPLHSILNRDSPVYLQYDYALITRGWGWFDHRFRWALCILCAGVWTDVAWWNGKQAYAYPYIVYCPSIPGDLVDGPWC